MNLLKKTSNSDSCAVVKEYWNINDIALWLSMYLVIKHFKKYLRSRYLLIHPSHQLLDWMNLLHKTSHPDVYAIVKECCNVNEKSCFDIDNTLIMRILNSEIDVSKFRSVTYKGRYLRNIPFTNIGVTVWQAIEDTWHWSDLRSVPVFYRSLVMQ